MLAARIERPVQGACGHRVANDRYVGHRGTAVDAEHVQQRSVVGLQACGDPAGLHRDHRRCHGVGTVDVAHRERAMVAQGRIAFGERKLVTVHAIGGDGGQVIAARDRDRHGLAVGRRRAIVVCGGDGVGQHQGFTRSKVVEIEGAGVEAPVQRGAALAAAQHGGGCERQH